MELIENLSLKKRFASDMNLPIGVFDEPYFSYFLNLYEDSFQSLTKWKNLSNLIETTFNNNAQLFLDEYYQVRDKMINDILNSDSYKEFNNMDMSIFNLKNYNFPSSNIYNENNVNKKFISIDLKKANFQALRLVNVINDDTYDKYVSRYTNIQYIKDSKYTRQVVFGKLNPKRQISVEKYIVSLIHTTLSKLEWFNSIISKVESFASDEVVYSVNPNVDDYTVNYVINNLSSYIKNELGYFTDVEFFKLTNKSFFTHNNNKITAYIKSFLNIEKKDEILTVPMFYYAQIYKLLNNLPIEDNDLMFVMEGQLAKFINSIKIEK